MKHRAATFFFVSISFYRKDPLVEVEAQLLRRVKHRNIVTLHQAYTDPWTSRRKPNAEQCGKFRSVQSSMRSPCLVGLDV